MPTPAEIAAQRAPRKVVRPDRPVYWNVQPLWQGEPAFILGGGKCLTDFDVGRLEGKAHVIAIKEAGLTLASWADVLYWADAWWCDGNKVHKGNSHRLGLHRGAYKICRDRCDKPGAATVHVMKRDTHNPLARDRSAVAGWCAGAGALNLAFHFGARPIVMLGFPLRGPNWDGRPRRSEKNNTFANYFIPSFTRMGAELDRLGVQVWNATPDSALTCFPIMTPDEALARLGLT